MTGTYRRLGDTYILTNDLEGMAAHSARIAVWEDTLKKLVDERTAQWRADLVQNGSLRKIPFDSAFADSLSSGERANLEANDRPNNQTGYLPVGQTNSLIQQTMKTLKNGLDVDRERVGLASNMRYEIILPNVGRAWWRGWLGNTEQFDPKPYVWTPPNPAPVALPFVAKGSIAGVALHADTPAEAKKLVARVASLGISELWLETSEAKTLAAAVEAGTASNLKVSLAIRPWALIAGESASDPDRTATMEHGRALAAQKAAIPPFQSFWADISAFASPTREFIAPLDAATNAHLARLRELAATKGLAKVALFDLYPTGYGKEESRMSGSYWYSNGLDAYLSYGYTDALRQAFLRAEGVDPLDLESQMVRTEANLQPAWGDRYGTTPKFSAWQTAKGKWSHDRAVALTKTLTAAAPSLPILLPGEPPANHLPPLAQTYFFRLSPDGALPLGVMDFGGGEIPEATELQVMEIMDVRDPFENNRVAARIKKALEKRTKPILFDLTSVPQSRLDSVLTHWLK